MQPEALADIVLDVLRPLAARLTALEGRAAGDLTGETIATLRERLAVLETRAPVPGPPGADGLNGKDGMDGLGFGDLTLEHDGERTVTVKAVRDGQTKDVGVVTFPVPLYRGVWTREAPYVAGDVVTFGGSGWICRKDTTTQPETAAGAGFWQLFVKRGERGK